jgi:hypothetical protein
MSLHPETVTYPVYPAGAYKCVVSEIKLTERPRYKAMNGEMESAFQFTFDAFSETAPNGKHISALHEDKPIRFNLLTSVNYGGARAMLTKVINGMLGKSITKDEAVTLDLENFIGTEVVLLVGCEINEQNEKKNTIADISRLDGVVQNDIQPYMDQEMLLKKDPFVTQSPAT